MTGEHMLNIGGLHEGVVLDHIPAGKAMDIYKRLKLDKLDCQVAMIMHARSSKMGQKDIIKVEAPLELLNLDALGFIDHTITVNIIKDAKIVEKQKLRLPRKLINVIHCKNPRCITSIEQGLDHVFYLADEENELYRCVYCEEKWHGTNKRG
jgi:aspartate carbamoyltransferase regulatory subunit